MTRPSPRPRPKSKAALGVTSQKSPSERLTGVEDTPAPVEKPQPKQVTWLGKTFLKAEDPIGFAAAYACKKGEGMVSGSES